MPRTIRDVQRKKVVAAEHAAWWSPYNQDVGFEGIQQLVQRVCADRNVTPLQVTPGDGDLQSFKREIVVPDWATKPLIVLHHLAHMLVPQEFPSHGAEFAERYLELVQQYAGPQLWSALRGQFIEHGVHHNSAHRIFRCRRVIVNAVNNRPGVLAEIVCADPPEQLIGPLTGFDHKRDMFEMHARAVPIRRVRYVFLLR